jgi:hypothetical protein
MDSRQVGLRSSEWLRAQPLADATQIERAMWLAQRRDGPPCPGTDFVSSNSVLNFSTDEICSRASRMGVSLGESSGCKAASIKLLKDTELERSLTMLKKVESTVESDFLAPHNLVVSDISTLCDDLNEEVVDVSGGVVETMVSAPPYGRTKKIYDNISVHRSKRIKNLKNKISK